MTIQLTNTMIEGALDLIQNAVPGMAAKVQNLATLRTLSVILDEVDAESIMSDYGHLEGAKGAFRVAISGQGPKLFERGQKMVLIRGSKRTAYRVKQATTEPTNTFQIVVYGDEHA